MTLTLHDISFTYQSGRKSVLDHVSCEAQSGRVCAIVGPNAAGKSTLLRVILGVHKPTSGTIMLHDESLLSMRPSRRAGKLAYVAQQPTVDAPYTVRDVIALGRFAVGMDETAIDRALDICELTEFQHVRFHELSVGQQQRVALARALAQIDGKRDAVLLLDEPMAAMDPHHVVHTSKVIREIARSQNTAVLIVLHDLLLASMIADDVWLMSDGRLKASGPAGTVLVPERLEETYGVRFTTPEKMHVRALIPDYEIT